MPVGNKATRAGLLSARPVTDSTAVTSAFCSDSLFDRCRRPEKACNLFRKILSTPGIVMPLWPRPAAGACPSGCLILYPNRYRFQSAKGIRESGNAAVRKGADEADWPTERADKTAGSRYGGNPVVCGWPGTVLPGRAHVGGRLASGRALRAARESAFSGASSGLRLPVRPVFAKGGSEPGTEGETGGEVYRTTPEDSRKRRLSCKRLLAGR